MKPRKEPYMITEEERARKAKRRETLGASEAAMALALSPYGTPKTLWLEKMGMAPEQPPTLPMRVGLALEPLIRELYYEETEEWVTEDQRVYQGKGDYDFLTATIDGMSSQGWPSEFKSVNAYAARVIGEEGTDKVPDQWMLQGHQQMYLTETDRVDFAVLIGNSDFRVLVLRRNEDVIKLMLPQLAEFWDAVKSQKPPREIHKGDEKIMHMIYPNMGPPVDLAFSDQVFADVWLDQKRVKKLAEEEIDRCKRVLLDALGDAAFGRLPDGRILTRSIIEVRETTPKPRKGYKFTKLTIGMDKKAVEDNTEIVGGQWV